MVLYQIIFELKYTYFVFNSLKMAWLTPYLKLFKLNMLELDDGTVINSYI